MLVSWDWIKEYLGETDLTADQAVELLGTHAFEIEGVKEKGGDIVIDVDILPNRASDCLCHRGIARELSSITGTSLVHDPLKLKTSDVLSCTNVIEVKIEDTHACPRFTASLINGIKIKESPEWLKKRLEAIGQRPINNIVDATNYVMFAIGQPIHAYDAELFPQIDGKWQFGVRFAKEGEVVSLIAEGGKDNNNDEDRNVKLQGTELLIIDNSSDTPIGLAGVKGGRFAGIHDGTTQIIIEAAHFDSIITRKTARRLGIVIDASKRFENEPARELPLYAQAEIIKLILEIAGGTYEGTVDSYLEKKVNKPVKISVHKTNSLLGLSLSVEKMEDILQRVGCEIVVENETMIATGPWERTDLNIEEDFIEEIGRLYGYEHIQSILPEAIPLVEINKRHYYSEIVRECLIGQGFSEVITSSFRKKDKVQLKNALASDKSYLRSILTKNITEALDKNSGFTDLLGTDDTRIFEIGTVFHKTEDSVTEHVSLAFGVRIKSSGYTGKEDKILEEVLTTLETAINTSVNHSIEKGVAEINFTELLIKLPKPETYQSVPMAEEIVYKPFSIYPHMSRDIALWVTEGTSAEDVETILNESAGDWRVRTTLFDEFTKEGRTSYAFRIVFQSKEKTLTDEEINEIMDKINKVAKEKNWEVR